MLKQMSRDKKEQRKNWGEVICNCPRCKVFETLEIFGDEIVPTRKFWQKGNKVYHDCGGEKPVKLFKM